MIQRVVHMARLKSESVDEYVRLHGNVPKELEAAYRRAGITDIGCFLNGCDLLVYTEYDDTQYPASQAELAVNEAEVAWQALMATFSDKSVEPCVFREVYRLGH